jgi:hypothetical protein
MWKLLSGMMGKQSARRRREAAAWRVLEPRASPHAYMQSGLRPLKLVPKSSSSAEGADSYQPGAAPQEIGISKYKG